MESAGDTPKPETVEDSISQTQLEHNNLRLQPSNDFTDYETVDGASAIDDALLPPTLETRKRRKYSATSTDKQSDMDCKSIEPDRCPKGSQNACVATPPDDDFKFNRANVIKQHEHDSPCDDLAIERSHEANNDSMGIEQPKRKALKPSTCKSIIPSRPLLMNLQRTET